MAARHKILLLDDDEEVLELYQEMLGHMPSDPEVHTATSGARAIALLESEPFTLLISDLQMPKMDGLQVLTIVRKRFPQLRTAVLTAISDEQFRSRAYAIGIDLFLEKPNSSKEITLFLECVESLLGKEAASGFRGVQSKGLVDLIQLECLSRSSAALKITHNGLEGKIWIQKGEVVDAATQGLGGEEAFRRILGWQTGNFEILPADPARPRTILASYQGLLLETAQAMDEAKAEPLSEAGKEAAAASPLSRLARSPGIEFLLAVPNEGQAAESWGLDNPEEAKDWLMALLKGAEGLAEKLQLGELRSAEGMGLQRRLAAQRHAKGAFCAGFQRSFPKEKIPETMKHILSQWAS